MVIIVVLIVLGLALGSFVNALVWRIHEQAELSEKKASQKRQKYAKDLSIVTGRSMCIHCHHQLAIKDLIPLASWLWLRGKCRYCQQPIGWQYPLVEGLTAGLFIFSYTFWPVVFHGAGLVEFLCWLAFLTGFMALGVYDLKWYLLPNRIVYPLLVLALIQVLIVFGIFHTGSGMLLGSVWGALVGGGLFWMLFQVSKGKWIGGGDVKLGALLGLLIGGPVASALLIFVASLAGSAVSLPLIASGKIKRTSLVPFGPFLLLAAIVMRLFGASLISWLRQRAILPPL